MTVQRSPLRPDTLEKLAKLRGKPPREANTAHRRDDVPMSPEQFAAQLESAILAQSMGEALQRARKERDLTTRALAQKVQLSQSRIVQIEHANASLELQTVALVAHTLGYRVNIELVPEDQSRQNIRVTLPHR
jgi:ribosome-binding protein aMBF1 (putative translation factor)